MAYKEHVIFDSARKILLAGAWLIENGHGHLALLPYVYATGHWRCEFHIVGRPKKTAFRYSIANGPAYLASHCGGSISKDVEPEKLAQAIWVSVPDDLKDACSGEASRETLEWVAELRRQIGMGYIPTAFGENFGERNTWQLKNVADDSDGLTMPAMPGYVEPGKESSVLEDEFWTKAERRAKSMGKRPEFSLSGEILRDSDLVFDIANRLRRDMVDADNFEAPRLLKAAIAALHSESAASTPKTLGPLPHRGFDPVITRSSIQACHAGLVDGPRDAQSRVSTTASGLWMGCERQSVARAPDAQFTSL